MNRRNLLLFLALGMMVSEGNRERRHRNDSREKKEARIKKGNSLQTFLLLLRNSSHVSFSRLSLELRTNWSLSVREADFLFLFSLSQVKEPRLGDPDRNGSINSGEKVQESV